MGAFVGMMVFLVLFGLLLVGSSIVADAAKRKEKAAEQERRWKEWENL